MTPPWQEITSPKTVIISDVLRIGLLEVKPVTSFSTVVSGDAIDLQLNSNDTFSLVIRYFV